MTAEQIGAARYIGSSEHKTERWWGGLPGAYVGKRGKATRPKKQLTTICPLAAAADRDAATGWVRAALTAGQHLYHEGDKVFPSRVWFQDSETRQIWLGYCINSILGEYKGWPIEEDERVALFR